MSKLPVLYDNKKTFNVIYNSPAREYTIRYCVISGLQGEGGGVVSCFMLLNAFETLCNRD